MNGYILNGFSVTAGKKTYLKYHGVLHNGKTFILVQENPPIIAFTKQSSLQYSGISVKKTISDQYVSLMTGEPLDLHFFHNIADLRVAEETLGKDAILESDIDPAARFLMEKKIRCAVNFKSPPVAERDGMVFFRNPKVAPSEQIHELRTASIDIENSEPGHGGYRQLYSIGIHSGTFRKVIMLHTSAGTDDFIEYVTTEKELILSFIRTIQTLNPQVIIGWYVVGYDFDFLINRSEELNIPFNLGIDSSPVESFVSKVRKERIVKIPGRAVLDGIQVLKTLNYSFDKWSLDFVGNALLGAGKLIHPNDDKVKEITNLFNTNKKKLAEYNIMDCELVSRIFLETNALPRLIARSCINGSFLEKQHLRADIFDSLYLPVLHRRKAAASNTEQKKTFTSGESGSQPLRYITGTHRNILKFKFPMFSSAVMHSFFIDPLGRFRGETDENNSLTGFDGLIPYHRTESILPEIFSSIKNYKKKDRGTSHLWSEAADSVYETISSAITLPSCRFFSQAMISSINANKQKILDTVLHTVESKIKGELVYINDDSLYIRNDSGGNAENEIVQEVKSALSTLLEKKKTGNYFDFEYCETIDGLFLPDKKSIAQSDMCGLMYAEMPANCSGLENSMDKIRIFSKKVNRAKWCAASADFQRKILQSLFCGTNPADIIHDFKKRLFDGSYDKSVVLYQKLKGTLEEYASEPSGQNFCLDAARTLGNIPERAVEFIITENGGEPAQNLKSAINYDYYFENFFLPIADCLLSATAYAGAVKSFSKSGAQLSFFDAG